VVLSNIWIIFSTKDQIIDQPAVAEKHVCLVLGTSRYGLDGKPNKYFTERMNKAADLFHKNLVSHILVSGDNQTKYYNEPREMLDALGDLQISSTNVSLDYAGFRTLDSIVRAREVFGQDTILIVTQQFHCYRSLFISNHFDIYARAVPAGRENRISFRLAVREVMARTLTVIDLYLLNRKPRYLGEKVELPV
jgi:SanA protein